MAKRIPSRGIRHEQVNRPPQFSDRDLLPGGTVSEESPELALALYRIIEEGLTPEQKERLQQVKQERAILYSKRLESAIQSTGYLWADYRLATVSDDPTEK